jgi:hypothetical protein
LLIAFCAFIKYRSIQSLPIGDNWTSITQEEYDEFRCSTAFDGTIYGICSRAIADFKLGIKHDTSDPKATNLRLDSLGGETSTPITKSHHDSNESSIDFDDGETKENHRMPVAGKVLLIDLQEDGQQKADDPIVRAMEDDDGETADNPTRTALLCSITDEKSEEIMDTEIPSYIESDELEETSALNVMTELENGEITCESVAIIAATDPITCAIYAKDDDLLELDGLERFKAISRRQGKLLRTMNQAKLCSYRTAQCGFEVPKDYQHAVRLDERAVNTKWQDSTKVEMTQLDDYNTFNDYGHPGRPPGKYKVRVHQLCNSGTLVDGGANGGVAGADLRVVSMTGRHDWSAS